MIISLISCRSVKKNTHTTETKSEIKTEQITQVESQTENLATEQQETILDNLKFQIEPICERPAVFTFLHNGKEIKGKTTGKLIFNNEKKHQTQDTRIENREAKSEDTKAQSQYKIVYKDRVIEKEVKQGFSLWFWVVFVLGVIALWELLKYTVKSRLKIWIK